MALLAEGKLIALDAPEELRRSVFGGDVLQVDAEQPIDPQLVANVPEVIAVQQAGARRLIVTATQAGLATPRLIEAFRAAGVTLVSVEEHQPSFDEVFTELVQRRQAADADDRTQRPMGSLWRSLVRVTSFSGKELRETLRRPGMLFALVLGPFLVMLLFGLGYTGQRQPFATEVVIPAGSSLPRDAAFYQELAPGRIQVRLGDR